MKSQFLTLLIFWLLANVPTSAQIQPDTAEEPSNRVHFPPLPIQSLTPNGIFSVCANFGISYDDLNTGIVAVQKNDTNKKEKVLVGPGGGIGLDLGVGRKLSKNVSLILNSGFQFANGTPKIDGASIRFFRMFVRPEIDFNLPLGKENGIELGLGGYVGFAQNLKLKPPSGSSSEEVIVRYKANLGTTGHLFYTNTSEEMQFFIGLRFHWVTLQVNEVEKGGQIGYLTQQGKDLFDKKNGGGVTLAVGFRFFF